MDDPAKLNWIDQNRRLYVVLWLRISRLADYFYCYFNHWRPRGNTGYMDPDCQMEPSEIWDSHQQILKARLAEQGFALASDELLRTRVPFVLEHGYDEIPDGDPRWDDEKFEPPLVPTSVHECLFGD